LLECGFDPAGLNWLQTTAVGQLDRFKLGRLLALGLTFMLVGYAGALFAFRPQAELSPKAEAESIRASGDYLIRHLGPEGRFAYSVHLDGSAVTGEYNVLRHAGAIYALTRYYEFSRDPKAREAILRAAQFLLKRHIRPVVHQQGMRAAFSLPGEEIEGTHAQVKLGGCALGLVALIKARELNPNLLPLKHLREMGRFILFMQEPNGRFHSIYEDGSPGFREFDSLYYPGEAILALTLLHQVDPDPRWLEAARRGMAYLEESRRDLPVNRLPNDHWLMIATAAALPQFRAAGVSSNLCQRLWRHSLDVGKRMMSEQWRTSWVPGLDGSFVSDGAITPSSTRLEGLLALYPLLPSEGDRARVQRSVETGLSFILRAQVKEGVAGGGFRGSLLRTSIRSRDNLRAEVRIDYVQHALCALLAHYQLFHSEEQRSRK
jgi:hypothetical protein